MLVVYWVLLGWIGLCVGAYQTLSLARPERESCLDMWGMVAMLGVMSGSVVGAVTVA